MLKIEDVEAFHKAFGHPVKDSSEYLSHFTDTSIYVDKLLEFRYDLIKEEVEELRVAITSDDPVETADALFDLLYVTYGAILALGVPQSVGDEVQRSNMSKGVECSFCSGSGMVVHSWDEDGQVDGASDCPQCNGTGIVAIKREDGKILKGPNFSPVDIVSILEKECGYVKQS